MSRREIELGKYCEDRAVLFLKKKGYRILERNYRSLFGELDVIARDGNTLVFIEVKSLTSSLFGSPYLKLTKKKRANIIKSVLSYLKRKSLLEAKCRIDVISISLDKKGDEIELIKNAFDANGRNI